MVDLGLGGSTGTDFRARSRFGECLQSSTRIDENPWRFRRGADASAPEVLRKLQTLSLVVRADALAVKLVGY